MRWSGLRPHFLPSIPFMLARIWRLPSFLSPVFGFGTAKWVSDAAMKVTGSVAQEQRCRFRSPPRCGRTMSSRPMLAWAFDSAFHHSCPQIPAPPGCRGYLFQISARGAGDARGALVAERDCAIGVADDEFTLRQYDSCGTSAPQPQLGTTRLFRRFDRGNYSYCI